MELACNNYNYYLTLITIDLIHMYAQNIMNHSLKVISFILVVYYVTHYQFNILWVLSNLSEPANVLNFCNMNDTYSQKPLWRKNV